MQNDSETTEKAAKAAAKEARRKKWSRIAAVVTIPFALIVCCGWESLLLKNLPLLVAFFAFFGGMFLLDFAVLSKIKKFKKHKFVCITFFGLPCVYAYMFLFICVMNCLPVTAISRKTTYLTEPRTPDGKMLDIPAAIAQRFLPDCPPEENGFREVVQAFGFRQIMADVPEEHGERVARRLFAALKIDNDVAWNVASQVAFEPVGDFFEKHLPDEALVETPDKADAVDADDTDVEAGDDDADHANGTPVIAEKDRRYRVWDAVNSLYCLPWPEVHRELGLQWLAENNAALDRFGEAVRRPEYFVPFFQNSHAFGFLELLDNYDQFHREMVRGLHLRILHSLEQGDFDRAKYDLLTIARLAEHRMRHPRTVMNLFLAVELKGIALNTIRNMLQYGQATHEQLTSLWEELAPYQHEFSQSDVIFLMRMEGMQALYSIGTGDLFLYSNEHPSFHLEISRFQACAITWFYGGVRYVGWTPVFQKYNDRMSTLEIIAEMPLSPEQLTLFDTGNLFKTDRWFDFGDGTGGYLKYVLKKGVVQLIPDTIGTAMTRLGGDSSAAFLSSTIYRHASLTRMTEIAFALEHYALDHDGAYPESLDALTNAGYLATLPTDPCTDGEAFRYRLREGNGELREGNGKQGYILYGFGINMRDDNGVEGNKVDPETGEEHRGDDIVIEMPRLMTD